MRPTLSAPLFAIVLAASITGSLRAETLSFPKDNPAFTVEVPPGEHGSVSDERGVTIGGVRIFEVNVKPDANEQTIKKTMLMWVNATMSSRLRPAETPKVEPTKEQLAPGVPGYLAYGSVKGQPSFDSSGGSYWFTAVMFQAKDGRFFYADGYDALGGPDLLEVTKSLKPITK